MNRHQVKCIKYLQSGKLKVKRINIVKMYRICFSVDKKRAGWYNEIEREEFQ